MVPRSIELTDTRLGIALLRTSSDAQDEDPGTTVDGGPQMDRMLLQEFRNSETPLQERPDR